MSGWQNRGVKRYLHGTVSHSSPKWQCVVTNKWSVTSCYGSFQILEGVEMERSDKKSGYCDQTYHTHGCQMAIARFLDHRHLALQAWATMAPLCCAAKFDPFLSLDCARVKGRGRIWQPWSYLTTSYAKNIMKDIQGGPSPGEPGLAWLRFGEFPQLWAITVATYCPSRMVEHHKCKSTEPSPPGDGPHCNYCTSTIFHFLVSLTNIMATSGV